MATIVQYLVVIEKGATCYGAYVPDLPGCVAIGKTEREVLRHIEEAIRLKLQTLRQAGVPIEEPVSSHRYIFVNIE